MLSGRVQVPFPLFTATRLIWAPTVTRIAAVVSFTVPDRAGVVSLVVKVVTVITGTTVSTTSSLADASEPTFPAVSVALTTTL